MKFLGTVLSVAFATALLVAAPAYSFCGLQSCPRIDPHGSSHRFEAALRSRAVSFDIGDEDGFYTLLAPRLFVKVPGLTGLSLGTELPWVTLHTAEYDRAGLGNALVTVQYTRRLSSAWSAELGLQGELPVGDTEHGLADDHMMILPWVGARQDFGTAWYSTAMLGYIQAVGGESQDADDTSGLAKRAHNGIDHGDGTATPTLVNPHGDREVQWRAALGRRMGGAWTVEGFGLGQADLSDSNIGFYLRGGVSVDWSLTSAVGLHFVADAPVSPSRRSGAALGVDVKVGW